MRLIIAVSRWIAAATVRADMRVIILRMSGVATLDVSAMRTLQVIEKICREQGVVLLLSHVHDQPLAIMKKSGFYQAVGEERFLPNIDEALAFAARLVEEDEPLLAGKD